MKTYEELARLRVNEAIRSGLEAQRVERMLAEGQPPAKRSWPALIALAGLVLGIVSLVVLR